MNTNLLTKIFLSTILLVASQPDVSAAKIYANASTGSDITGTGSEGAPYQSFNTAYTNATAGDTLLLAGTFDWSVQTTGITSAGYTLSKNLTIIGQGANSTFIQAASDYATAMGGTATHNRRVFTIAASTTIKLESLTIQNGRRSDDGGGGIYNGGTLTLSKVILTRNAAVSTATNETGNGGGLQNYGTVNVENCEVSYNYANLNGGGIGTKFPPNSVDLYQINLLNSTIVYNEVADTYTVNGFNSSGGGVCSNGHGLNVTNCTIAFNDLSGGAENGAGLFFRYYGPAELHMKNTVIIRNKVSGVEIANDLATDFHERYQVASYDNGGNVIGSYMTFWGFASGKSNDSWFDIDGNGSGSSSIDGTYERVGDLATGTANLSSTLALNSSQNDTKSLAITSSGSILVNNGLSTANNGVTIPGTDQRELFRAGSTDIGAFEMGGTGLPVELTTFGAVLNEENSVNLYWETASELDNDRFEIYRSIDGVTWDLVHTQDGAGTSLQALSYQAEDRNPYLGVNYYQLKQIDFNGNSETFEPVRVEVIPQDEVILYPNPAKTFISVTAAKGSDYVIRDLSGKTLAYGKTVGDGATISVESLLPGRYFLEIDGEQFPFVKLD